MPRSTPLFDRERALGATFATVFAGPDDGGFTVHGGAGLPAGFEVAAHFGDPAAEHRAVRESAGLFDTAYLGVVEAQGPHRVRFLNGQVTADLRPLVDGQGAYAATLTPTGKMVADLRIYAVGETFLLVTPPGAARAVIDHLSHFRVADRVAFTDVSASLSSLLVQGPASPAVVEAALGTPLPPAATLANLTRRVDLPGGEAVDVRLCRYSATGEEGFEILCPTPRVAALYDRLLEVGRPMRLRPAGFRALDSLRIEAGIPWFGVDMNAATNPLEARLSHAISLNKGCYTGQEVIAKATYIGQVNRLLVGLVFPEGAEDVAAGDPVRFADKEVGRITSLVDGPTVGRTIALAMVRREAAEPSTRLVVGARPASGGATPRPDRAAVVTALPFYTP